MRAYYVLSNQAYHVIFTESPTKYPAPSLLTFWSFWKVSKIVVILFLSISFLILPVKKIYTTVYQYID